MKQIIKGMLSLALMSGGLIVADPISEIEKIGRHLLPTAALSSQDQKKIFISNVESKQAMLASYQAEKNRLEEENRTNARTIATDLDETLSKMSVVGDMLKKDPDNEFLKRKKTLLNEDYYSLREYQQTSEQQRHLVDQIIKLLTTYLSDPENKKLIEQFHDKKKTFEELQVVYQKVIEEDKSLESLTDQEKNAMSEVENRKRASIADETLHQEQKEKRASHPNIPVEGMSLAEDEELWQLKEKLFEDKKRVDTLKFAEIKLRLELIRLKMFVARSHKDTLKDLFRDMTSAVQVSAEDVASVKEDLEKKKQKFYTNIRGFDNEIDRVNNTIKMQKQELDTLAKRYNIVLDADVDKWSKEPKQLVSSYVGICEVGAENDEILYLQRRKDHFKSLVSQENEKIRQEETQLKIKETFHKIRFAKFGPKELDQELKNYDMIKAGIRAHTSLYNERKNTLTELLETQKRSLEKLDQLRNTITNELRDTLFRDHNSDYLHCLALINKAKASIDKQIVNTNLAIGNYTNIISLLNATSKQVDFIVLELNSTTIWYRPQYAVSWEGFTHIIPDVERFARDLTGYIGQIRPLALIPAFQAALKNPMSLFLSLLIVLAMVVGMFLIRFAMPWMLHHIQIAGQTRSYFYTLSMLLVAVGRFFLLYFNGIALWFIGYGIFKFQVIDNPYLHSIFYLVSIPYVLYLAHQLISYIAEFNQEHGYLFLSKDFEFRFTLIVSALMYVTIILFLFKAAFMLGDYRRSELPSVLVAFNFIFIQVMLIALIPKDHIINLIPTHDFWGWIRDQVDRYYYLILLGIITIIVMSNPYVGFGRLVSYVIWRILYTAILAIGLMWLYRLIKRFCAYFFFVEDEDVPHARFTYAKSLYGISVIMLVCFFTGLGIIILAKIWGWPEQLAKVSQVKDVVTWLQHPFTNVDQQPISVWTLLRLIFFVLGGLGISFAFNKFVMGKIFDMLLIESGVQNTISSITYYLCFVLSVIIGFNAAGLTSLLYWILALVVGIGWIIKDPVSDFVSYFIILVQRPIKVGDLIRLEDEAIPGVVRRITPRSILIRRRNSTTVIIPNSVVINKNITNWNYTRDFIAFEDIHVTIPYGADVTLVQRIFLTVLSENPYILKNPKPIVRLDDFSENGYTFMVRGYLNSNYTLDQWDIASEVRFSMIRMLREAGIDVAIPVRRLVSSGTQLRERQQ